MATLQELIHRFEVGEGARLVRWLAALLALLALTWWYDTHEFQNFNTAEAMETAQLARNLARGEGFTTRCIRPFSLYLVEQHRGIEASLGQKPHPDLVTPPLYPLLLAGLMKVLPFNYDTRAMLWNYQPEVLIAVGNQVLFFATLWLVFRLARRLFDTEVALISLALLAASDVLWRFTTSGLSTVLAMFLVTAVAWVFVRLTEAQRVVEPSRRKAVQWAVLGGLLIGLAGLTRYSLLSLLIPWIALPWIFGARHKFAVGLVGVLVAAAVVAPWIWRNYHQSGTPFGVAGYALYQGTPQWPGDRLERSIAPASTRVGARELVNKLVEGGLRVVRDDLPRMGGNWLGGFLLGGLILRFRNPTVSRLRTFVILTLIVLCVAQAAGRTHVSEDSPALSSENLMILLAPLVVVFGAGLLSVLLDQLDFPIPEMRHAITVILVGVAAVPLLLTFLPPRSNPISYPPYYPQWVATNAGLLEADELMMSDLPWAVAWYGNRQCVWIPTDANESFYEINDRHKRVAALYLTQQTSDARFLSQLVQGRDHDWGRFVLRVLVDKRLPTGFPLTHAWQRYMPDQLFFADRPRWLERPPEEEPADAATGGRLPAVSGPAVTLPKPTRPVEDLP